MPDLAAVLLRFALYGVLGLLFGLLAFRQYSPACRIAPGGNGTVIGLAIFGLSSVPWRWSRLPPECTACTLPMWASTRLPPCFRYRV